jgi:hypothetical protein
MCGTVWLLTPDFQDRTGLIMNLFVGGQGQVNVPTSTFKGEQTTKGEAMQGFNRTKCKTLVVTFTVFVLIPAVPSIFAQAHERHQQALAASAEIKPASGGKTFVVAASYEKVFAEVVRYINLNNLTVNKADRETGFIGTELEISKGHHQTGTNFQVIVIKTDDAHVTLRVAVLTRRRYNVFQPDPWDEPKVDDKQTADFAEKLQAALSSALAPKS